MANRLIKVAVQRFSAASSREGLGGAVTEKDNTGRKLERRVADLYRRIGAHKVEHDVEIAGHQIDVYVEMPTWDHSVHRIIVQAKDWSGKVGIAEVATFQGVMRPLRDAHHADEGVMVSAVGYSKQGRNAAKTHGIRLLEIEDLESMADRAEKENVEPVGRQRQLYHALKSRSEPLAAIYLGAWMMARSHSNPDWMALAAHGMRELLDALADSGAGKTGSRPNLQHQVNGLREKWKRMVGQSTCYNSGNWNGPVDPGLRAFLRAARGFFEMQTQRFPTKPEKAKQTLLRFDLAPVPVDDTLLKLGSDKWMEFHKFFSRVAHHELVPDAAQLQERIAQCERFLLDRLIPDTFNDLRDVDEIIEEGETIGVTDELVERALDIIARRGVSCSHFFEHLSSPEWIRPLRDKDVFSTPPSPVVEGDTISLPPWFQSRYLARMASKAPDVVLEVIQGIPSTTNPRIHDNFVEAALAMSARLSAELAQQALKWLDCSYPQHLAKLVVHLAQGGEVEQALPLAGSLLAIDVADTDNHRVKPKARISEWEYGEIAKEVVPALVEAAGDLTLRMLCDVLDRAVRLSRYDPDTAGGEDNSDIWRPAVEQDHDRHSHQVTDYLVTGVRDAADALGASGADAVRNVVQCLGSYRWRIFRRLEMYVLRVAMDGPLELIGERLMNPDLFRWPDHEYIMLLQQFYPRLSSSDRARILKLIDAGPDHEPSQEGEDPREYAERWQRNRLAIVAEYLPSGWKRRYEKLVEQHGEAVSLDRPARVFSGRCGPTSPKSAGELAAMSVADIVAYLQTWVPPGHWEDGTPLGLARVLEEVVRQDALRFASEATRFCEIDEPTYVRAVLEGLPAAVGKEGFDWARVLDLCDCVAGRPTETRQPKVGFDEKDPDWNGARRVVAKLFQCAFGTEGRIPFDLRERVWRTIAALACDPGPSPERESGSAMLDPTTQAINSTRGVAMEAVLRYAFWVHARQCGHDKRFPCTFDIMPEVRAVLDWHLDASNDRRLPFALCTENTSLIFS